MYIYPTAFGKPATVPYPGCVCSHVLSVCVRVRVLMCSVCVCVCIVVCCLQAHDVVVLSSFSGCLNLLCSDFINLWIDFGVILSISGFILASFWCPWRSFSEPVPSRGPPKGAESKM